MEKTWAVTLNQSQFHEKASGTENSSTVPYFRLFWGWGFPYNKPYPNTAHIGEPRKNPPTFHYTGWLIGILIMVNYNPYITG